jgi:hypothetical protein
MLDHLGVLNPAELASFKIWHEQVAKSVAHPNVLGLGAHNHRQQVERDRKGNGALAYPTPFGLALQSAPSQKPWFIR